MLWLILIFILFLAILDLTWHLENTRIGVFLVGLPHLLVRRQNLSSKQKAFSLAGKNTKVVLESFDAWKCVPTAVLDIPKVPRWHLLQQMNYQRGSQKITSGIGVSPTNILPFLSLLQFLTNGHIIKSM